MPWVQPWGTAATKAPLAMPKNAATGAAYSGINVLILWGAVIEHGFTGQSWLTFRQALALGGNVRKGEHGTTVVYADRFIPDDETRRAAETGEEAGAIPFLKRFTVFNTDQCEGLPEEIAASAPPPPPGLIEPTGRGADRGDRRRFPHRRQPRLLHTRRTTIVQVPPPQAYFEPINWHRTAFMNSGTASGHASRLNRDHSGSFGSKNVRARGAGRRDERVPSVAPRSASCRPCATPTTSAPGSRCCARIIAPSSAPPAQASKAADFLLAFLPRAIDSGSLRANEEAA